MSRATELAEAESVEEEAAEEEEVASDDDATDDDAPPQPPPQPVDSVKVTKALSREDEQREKTLRKIMGDEFDTLERCPLCIAEPHGYVLPFEVLPDEVKAVIRDGVEAYVSAGGPDLSEFNQAADMERCEVCSGKGLVRSGSENPNHLLEICNPCTGNGWKRKAMDAPPPPVTLPYQNVPPTPQLAPYRDFQGLPTHAPPDANGRAFGDPQYGQPITYNPNGG